MSLPQAAPGTLRVATWNVNSLRARMARLVPWLGQAAPDVCCLQETKLADEGFPPLAEELAAAGYDSAHHGNGRWNGVAILSRIGLGDVVRGFAPRAGDARATGWESQASADPGAEGAPERRLIGARCGPLHVMSAYVPNGREVGSPHYAAKLEWLRALRAHLDATCTPGEVVALCGDFNVAPGDLDVWNPAVFEGATHVSEPEREALRAVIGSGLVDAWRHLHGPDEQAFSWWDYRGGALHKGQGMRIDLVLLSRAGTNALEGAWIDRDARKGPQPSDHAPVVVDLRLD